ncbi:DUF3298 and DUF4163 domain-containing protein [Ethanoligenens harbinense]|uniref:DUF3298/DUF4163 domain-containing protein n=1 Tax=Ethanoligenens harbinense (strain DSM 18485 / JCM 12961 / CGMCC 1.5033 / YUAN-3) TaxID=663278 RepID=E6U741_ETHHY|nr:DUF3298 and DUF4163 domain-containing protein [Ethanoligenens harbinense]ADU28111.1 hypothetical protein Ethha_2618 [Ethanoligenens harbinense YUAN-3]AVQ97120.1 DUF3298/DUF4163 domain-containing protein [Ethanoligenens harbinense YUAN-3]AYF39782.1 DUF3298/DUF4163 domain-containing protein [Ethanoligenens harbinense]AYF42614.1 DUF3298/DUF4163 domain-containing protein [Ethanoligenens harbinense]QCN93363.1 DUF3298/DUF4163 domain-containing protein [Ethanoligenens harbinense]
MNEKPVTVTRRQIQGKPQYRGVMMVEIDIAYPRVLTKGSPAGQVISVFYDHAARRFYAYASRKLYADAVQSWREAQKNGYPFHAYGAGMTYEVPFNHGGLLSIYYDQYTYTGGAHGTTVRHADTWRAWDARRLPLNAFFSDPGYRNIIFRAIFAQIQRDPDKYFEDYQKNVFQYFDEKNYYLTPRGFAFFFQLYTIAPYVTGIPVFIVPYELFGDMLKIRPV